MSERMLSRFHSSVRSYSCFQNSNLGRECCGVCSNHQHLMVLNMFYLQDSGSVLTSDQAWYECPLLQCQSKSSYSESCCSRLSLIKGKIPKRVHWKKEFLTPIRRKSFKLLMR